MAPPKKRFPLVFVLLPLLAVLGVAGYSGLNMYREFQRSEAEDAEVKRLEQAAEAAKRERAKKAAEAVPKVEAPPDEDEDLANLPKGHKKTPKPPATGNQTPAQKAFFGFKSAYDKLEAKSENAARKFRARKLQLEDQYNDGAPTNAAKFTADCDATKAQILEALRNPENQ